VAGHPSLTRGRADPKLALVLLAFALFYVPFLTKAFHIDDPLFVWTAQHLRDHPLDFYGFDVNWSGLVRPMSQITKNPPLASYYLALAGSILGWSEPALHLAMLLPALGAIAGAYVLARELCARPGEAALVAAFTPAFFVSSTTLMCDVPMLCAFVWAIVLWRRGIRSGHNGPLAASSVCVSLAALLKYFGIALVPLLFAYAFFRQRRVGAWAAWLLFPLAVLGGYQWLTGNLYGQGLASDAASYALSRSGLALGPGKILVGLVFAGGCYLPLLFHAPRLWKGRALLAGAAVALITAGVLAWTGGVGGHALVDEHGRRWSIILHAAVFLVLGAGLVALAISDAVSARDEDAILLALWVLGTLAFGSFFNWTVNARSLLPMAPAVGILLVRAADRRGLLSAPAAWRSSALALTAVAALVLGLADLRLADAARQAAADLAAKLPGESVWFEGHWGFQYYAQQRGFRAVDLRSTRLRRGEVVVLPRNSPQVHPPPSPAISLQGVLGYRLFTWAATMNPNGGAGFYSDAWGPLPFAFGRASDEEYVVVSIHEPIPP
jgi:4-amino-4-deoxy-L-arabinose transferase-like glycosyltransferase